ncbi:MAG: T9SS type A sorting domain-containing protein, partial [Ignavibacteria bacterium]|nr:T9SS type A sorting domain-containing protein [Ignavibacteria bacterium]
KLNIPRITEKDNLILKFNPELKNGLNELKIVSYKNNTYDTAKFVMNVTSEVSLINIFNFPNPMKNDTKFDFILTGNEPPADCRIKIYTIAGRVIKEIVMPVSIGYNQIYWDGRDADGDNLANGVYFYRIFIRGNTAITSDVKKLVVLR